MPLRFPWKDVDGPMGTEDSHRRERLRVLKEILFWRVLKYGTVWAVR